MSQQATRRTSSVDFGKKPLTAVKFDQNPVKPAAAKAGTTKQEALKTKCLERFSC